LLGVDRRKLVPEFTRPMKVARIVLALRAGEVS